MHWPLRHHRRRSRLPRFRRGWFQPIIFLIGCGSQAALMLLECLPSRASFCEAFMKFGISFRCGDCRLWVRHIRVPTAGSGPRSPSSLRGGMTAVLEHSPQLKTLIRSTEGLFLLRTTRFPVWADSDVDHVDSLRLLAERPQL